MIHMQEEKRRVGTSLVGRRMGQHMGLRMLKVGTSTLRGKFVPMVEAELVRDICSGN